MVLTRGKLTWLHLWVQAQEKNNVFKDLCKPFCVSHRLKWIFFISDFIFNNHKVGIYTIYPKNFVSKDIVECLKIKPKIKTKHDKVQVAVGRKLVRTKKSTLNSPSILRKIQRIRQYSKLWIPKAPIFELRWNLSPPSSVKWTLLTEFLQ